MIVMLMLQRQRQLIELLKSNGNFSTTELAQKLSVSNATIRRDLIELEKNGQIQRIHGGAVAVTGPTYEIPFSYRNDRNDTAKHNIAAKAAKLIQDGSTLILDASSTAARLVPFLAEKTELTVITNSPRTALELAACHIRTMMTGGLLLENSIAFVGHRAEDFLEGISADYLFISCRGISEDGYLTDSSLEESDIRRTMLRCIKKGGKKVLCCDESKRNCGYTYRICRLEEMDVVITEKGVYLPSQFMTENKSK